MPTSRHRPQRVIYLATCSACGIRAVFGDKAFILLTAVQLMNQDDQRKSGNLPFSRCRLKTVLRAAVNNALFRVGRRHHSPSGSAANCMAKTGPVTASHSRKNASPSWIDSDGRAFPQRCRLCFGRRAAVLLPVTYSPVKQGGRPFRCMPCEKELSLQRSRSGGCSVVRWNGVPLLVGAPPSRSREGRTRQRPGRVSCTAKFRGRKRSPSQSRSAHEL